MMATPTFKRVSLAQFQQIIKQFAFTRAIDEVHMHHTWRPRRQDFRGHETIVGMWRHHTQTNGWADIAQHVTIDPEGFIWLGRNWNTPPASAAGHNGTRNQGPFMFEMIGDFDAGVDLFDGPQKETTLGVIDAVLRHFNLPDRALRFHNMMSSKSCPGGAIRYPQLLADLADYRLRHAKDEGLSSQGRAIRPFPTESGFIVEEAIQSLHRSDMGLTESADAEPHDGNGAHGHDGGYPTYGARTDGAANGHTSAFESPVRPRDSLSSADLARLRPHVVNLTAGRFSHNGMMTTTPEDVDAIFGDHLPRALREAGGQPVKILFFSHGGLVSESTGLKIAALQIPWWISNGVYPIHFVWETGLFHSIAQLLQRRPSTRGLDPRDLTDPVLEQIARRLGGINIWGAMKTNAQRSVDPPTNANPTGGGAHYVAKKLGALCDDHPGKFELHAVGHSAGSIFHAHFVPTARQLGASRFKSLQFLAPALAVDVFKERLLPLIGNGSQHAVEDLAVFTMTREYERKDHCARIYGKSLLYLIHHALEERFDAPLLGLEDSLRDDPDLRRLFGLGTTTNDAARIIWSPSPDSTGRYASRATAHGDFDNDGATMNSLLRRVLSKNDIDPIVDFPAARGPSTAEWSWLDEIDWPDILLPSGPQKQTHTTEMVTYNDSWTPALSPPKAVSSTGGRRVALCVGIDAYPDPDDRLAGCVNDAQLWSQALGNLGFETALLLDGGASRAAIEQSLRRLIGNSRPGDVLVFHYSGHGTQVDDWDRDEDDGFDEALCPFDFRTGALFLDDDIARLLADLPQGVNMTLFIDSCHSGTVTRFAVGPGGRLPPGTRARYAKATDELRKANRRFRAALRAPRALNGRGEQSPMNHTKFSACRDDQQALESNGNGEFTRRALQILQESVAGMNHAQFQARLEKSFGPNSRQNPRLDCPRGIETHLLLQPLAEAVQAGPIRQIRELDTTVQGVPSMEAIQLMSRAIHVLAQH